MNDKLQGTRFLRAVGITLALALLVWVPAFTQQVEVSGRVTSTVTGNPVSGVTVRVRGSSTSTVTDAQGKYSLTAPGDAVLVFSLIGRLSDVVGGTAGRAILPPLLTWVSASATTMVFLFAIPAVLAVYTCGVQAGSSPS